MPITRPIDWFLGDSETLLQPAYTSGNSVEALIDGGEYFSQLLKYMEMLENDGVLYLAAWRLTPNALLNPENVSNPISISNALGGIMDSGVKVRALLWNVPGTIGDFSPGHGIENLEMFEQINEHPNGVAILDDRLPLGTFPSHHQKYVLLGDTTQSIAFVGGIDIAFDRWDIPDHNEPQARASEEEKYKGWHDIQASIQGPAVEQIWKSFSERWTDQRTPNLLVDHSSLDLQTVSLECPMIGDPVGQQHVQILRTYPCRGFANPIDGMDDFDMDVNYPFAPNGDYSYIDALVKAIGKAELFIYLEDQYFWPCEIVDALADAAGRGVSIIVILTKEYDVAGLYPLHNYMQNSSIQKIIDQCNNPAIPSIYVYHLQQTRTLGQIEGDEIYVHAKTIIIDDCYAVIGSGNVNNRSMSNDSEIGVAVVDGAVQEGYIKGTEYTLCTFARELRIKLWSEHLGETIDDPLMPDGSPNGFPTDTNNPVHHTYIHSVSEPRWCAPSFVRDVVMNPKLSC